MMTGTPPAFESVGNTAIDDSATALSAFNLTPNSSYTCKSVPGGAVDGELSWNASTRVLTVKGTIFIDGSATINSSGAAITYNGQATLLSGTFEMKNSTACAVTSGSACNTTSGAWDPNTRALVIVADGDGAAGGAQAQSGDVGAGEGIHLKGSSFQGALISNKNINVETTSAMQGPMISVYHEVQIAQTGGLTFPAIGFAPSGAASVVGSMKGQLLIPRSFG